jgi:L-ascorbate metabolism protein UlaG (beta-lactamase superfamily)
MSHSFNIHYLYHSGFSIETENSLLIFDYYKDSVEQGLKNRNNGAIGETDLTTHKKIYVFSSHSHGDHFNPIILDWAKFNPQIRYILSHDIKIESTSDKIHFLAPYESLSIDDLNIKAYGSTDLGISFLVQIEGQSIFHAGDLNWWYWWEDTPEEIEKAEKWFKEEISHMEHESIDIVFFPVDQRLEQNYCIGAKYFIEKLKPKILIPMHFGDTYETTEKFAKEMKDSTTHILTINHRGQQLL